MKLTSLKCSGSWTCWTRSDGLIMSRIGELRAWKRASCFRLTYFVRVSLKSAESFSMSARAWSCRAVMRWTCALASDSSCLSLARRRFAASSSLRMPSSSLPAATADLERLATASSYL